MTTYRLHLLEVRDFKRIKFAQIPFQPGLTILGGKNAQGKTSAIDALVSVLGGAKLAPGMPVRKGSDKAELNLVLEGPNGKLYARRYFTDAGTALEVKNEEGFKAGTPQKLFDSFLGALALDPLAFTRVEGRKQVETFKRAFGIDTSAIDARREEAVEERKALNRSVRDLEGRFRDLLQAPKDTPDVEVSAAELSRELSAANERNAAHAKALSEAEAKGAKLANVDSAIEQQQGVVAELEARLAREREKLASWTERRHDTEVDAIAAKKAAEGMVIVDATPILERIAAVDRTNRDVRAKREREAARVAWKEATDRVEALSAEIALADREKADLIKAAELPVEGLSFDEDGLYLNGIPFAQASSAEQLRVSVPLAFASDSALKFAIIRDGSLLDDESMDLVARLVDEAGGQLIVERVGDGDADAIVFEDGVVRGQQPELAGVA